MSSLHTLDGVEVAGVPPELALYPFGVFTTFVAVEGTVLCWPDHVSRLTGDARTLWSHELDQAWLSGIVRSHLARLSEPSTVRVTLYPASFDLARPGAAAGCGALVSSRPTAFPAEPVADFAVRTVAHQRDLAAVKSTDLFTQLRLRRAAQLDGFDDVLFRQGAEVLEGSTWTVLVWRADEVATPAEGVLPSITAGCLGRIAEAAGWRYRPRPVALAELAEAELVLAVNANSPARAISRVDETALSVDRDLLTTLAEAYPALPRDLLAD